MQQANIIFLIALLGGACTMLGGAQLARAEEPRIVGVATARTVLLPAFTVKGIRTGETLLVTEHAAEIVKPDQVAQKSMPKPGASLDTCFVR